MIRKKPAKPNAMGNGQRHTCRAAKNNNTVQPPYRLYSEYSYPVNVEVQPRTVSDDLNVTLMQWYDTPYFLEEFSGKVDDSGEGRWTIQAAIDEAVPVPVLSAALYARFSSRNKADFANRMQSALRHEFGGHAEQPADGAKPQG